MTVQCVKRFSWILFTIPGVLTVRECNELEINCSAKESQCVHAEYSLSNCNSAGSALNFISANVTLQLKIKVKKNETSKLENNKNYINLTHK